MDRLIRTAWRAFWVGLGASAVLISQSVLTPASPAPVPASPEASPPAPLLSPAPAPAAAAKKSADPILSRNPFDSKTRLVPRG